MRSSSIPIDLRDPANQAGLKKHGYTDEEIALYNNVKGDPEYKDFEIVIEPNRQEGESTFMGASAVNMQRLVDNAIEKLKTEWEVDPGTANLIRLNVLETLADDLKARGAGRFAIKRAGSIIEGYQKPT